MVKEILGIKSRLSNVQKEYLSLYLLGRMNKSGKKQKQFRLRIIDFKKKSMEWIFLAGLQNDPEEVALKLRT